MARLVYLHQYFCKPTMNGGVRSYEFAKRLAADGYDVHVITSDRVSEFHGWRTEQVDGFTVHWISVKYHNSFGFLSRVLAFLRFSLLSSVRALGLRADLNFATSTPLTIALPALMCRFVRGTPYVFEVRDLWPEVPIKLGYLKGAFPIWLARTLERLAYKNASAVVALSPDMVRGVVAQGSKPEKVFLIPNASDTALLRLANSDGVAEFWRQRSLDPLVQNIVVYTGTLGRVNKVSYLVDVAAASASLSSAENTRFVVFGDGAEREEIIQYAEKLGVLGNNFFVFSPVKKSELALVLAGSKLSLSLVDNIPVLWGNSANKFFDAFAAGVPIGINHGGWQADVINEYCCGLVLETFPGAAAISIDSFLSDPDRLEKAKNASVFLGGNIYARDKLYSDFLSVINGCLPRVKLQS